MPRFSSLLLLLASVPASALVTPPLAGRETAPTPFSCAPPTLGRVLGEEPALSPCTLETPPCTRRDPARPWGLAGKDPPDRNALRLRGGLGTINAVMVAKAGTGLSFVNAAYIAMAPENAAVVTATFPLLCGISRLLRAPLACSNRTWRS